MPTKKKDTSLRNFQHRPFSFTVEAIHDMDDFQEVGDIGLTMNFKMTPEMARDLRRRLTRKLKAGELHILFTVHGVMR